MQYNFDINQKAIVELSKTTGVKLGLQEAVIIDFIAKFAHSGECEVIIIEGKVYYWLAYSKIIEECPLLGIKNKEVLARKIELLENAGILLKHYEAGKVRKTYFAFGPNYKHIVFDYKKNKQDVGGTMPTEKSSLDEAMPTEKSSTMPTEKSNYHNTIDHTSTPENFDVENTEAHIKQITRLALDIKMPYYPQICKNNPLLTDTDISNICMKVVLSNPNEGPNALMKKVLSWSRTEAKSEPRTFGPKKKEIFEAYWDDYNSREELEQAISKAISEGKEVKRYMIPVNALKKWGEETSDLAKTLATKLSTKPDINQGNREEDNRKNELEKQLKQL